MSKKDVHVRLSSWHTDSADWWRVEPRRRRPGEREKCVSQNILFSSSQWTQHTNSYYSQRVSTHSICRVSTAVQCQSAAVQLNPEHWQAPDHSGTDMSTTTRRENSEGWRNDVSNDYEVWSGPVILICDECDGCSGRTANDHDNDLHCSGVSNKISLDFGVRSPDLGKGEEIVWCLGLTFFFSFTWSRYLHSYCC